MKKIGIITCGKEPNYGACLQSFATQIVIEKLGYSCEIINYSFMDEKEYRHFFKGSLRASVSSVIHYKLRKSLHYAFDSFRSKYMRYSDEQVQSVRDFSRIKNNYNYFLVGSDQVWNPYLGIDTEITLLNFYEEGPKKISYASSFGVAELPEKEKAKYKRALQKFDSLSVREYTGQKIINELINENVSVVLDPTMLIRGDIWAQYEEPCDLGEPYILIYDMNHDALTQEIAFQISKKTGLRIVALSRIILPNREKIQTLQGISPSNFLWLVRNAEYVVTDSFHGTLFSINFHKRFFSVCPKAGEKIKTRITGYLESVGLSNRIVESVQNIDIEGVIEYDTIDLKIEEQRRLSIDYLKEALK